MRRLLMKRNLSLMCRSVLRFIDLSVCRAMACFLDCFRARDNRSTSNLVSHSSIANSRVILSLLLLFRIFSLHDLVHFGVNLAATMIVEEIDPSLIDHIPCLISLSWILCMICWFLMSKDLNKYLAVVSFDFLDQNYTDLTQNFNIFPS